MLPLLLAALGAVISVLAFPPFGPGFLVILGFALYLLAIRRAESPGWGALVGLVYGVIFFGGLIWWISKLGLVAVIPLVLANALFPVAFGYWMARQNRLPPWRWLLVATGSWAALELFRYSIPFNGFEWGALGYGLADQSWARDLSSWIGTSGLTVTAVLVAGALALALEPGARRLLLIPAGYALVSVAAFAVVSGPPAGAGDVEVRVAIVQGSTPCPFMHCPPNERLRTFEQHLALTQTIEERSVDLVVWSEGSTGSTNADPVQNPSIGRAIADEARRIGAWFIVGSDRPISDTHWVNANVVYDNNGTYRGEYRKQHPVPFGEYIPFRPLFEWIPALDQVPRDQIPGDGPVVWDTTFGVRMGSVISFEGAFARYPRQHVGLDAEFVVVASNEGSYGLTPASDQFIGMTRMRAAELSVPVVHAAVTGKSTVIDASGDFAETTELGTQEVFYGTFVPGQPSLYARIGELVAYLAVLAGIVVWWRSRTLVGSSLNAPKGAEGANSPTAFGDSTRASSDRTASFEEE